MVAANAKKASTKTGGDIFLQLIFNMTSPGVNNDRVLNGPTNDVWIDPWLEYLTDNGVTYNRNYSAVKLEMNDGKLDGVWVEKYQSGVPEQTLVKGDYYILAVPVEVADKLITEEVLKEAPSLDGIKELAQSVAWMNGIQFYFSDELEVIKGHCIYSDSPWALTSISQLLFWHDYNIQDRFDNKVKSILSVDISDWDAPGILESTGKKPARKCSYKEIKDEVWAQLKESLNVDGKEILRKDQLVHWHIDHDFTIDHQKEDSNKEPLLVNTINSWALRPEAHTEIPNLFLASDYVRTNTDLATMEGANEAARRAVNALIEASGEKVSQCKIWDLHEPDILAGLRKRDQKRFEKGLPYEMHIPFWVKLIEFFVGFNKRISGK